MKSPSVAPKRPQPICVSEMKRSMKAMRRISKLLNEPKQFQNTESLHAAKSSLYVAIEDVGSKIECLHSMNMLLRELLGVVNVTADITEDERHLGFKLLQELFYRFDCEL